MKGKDGGKWSTESKFFAYFFVPQIFFEYLYALEITAVKKKIPALRGLNILVYIMVVNFLKPVS